MPNRLIQPGNAVALTLLLLAAPAWASDPPAAAPPVVTLPAARRVAVGERFSLAPVVTNGGVPKWYAPDAGLREDRTFLDLIPDELATKLKGRVFYAEAAGTYRIVVYCGGDNRTASDVAICTVTAGDVPPAPPPGPGPTPPGPTPPGPTPAPIPGDGLRVLVTYETADLAKLPKDQVSVLYSQTVRGYLDSHCVKGPDGKTPEFRIWDQNVNTAAESPVWQAAFARPRKSVPWLIVSNPQKGGGWEGPLPSTVDETMKLLRTYGGP